MKFFTRIIHSKLHGFSHVSNSCGVNTLLAGVNLLFFKKNADGSVEFRHCINLESPEVLLVECWSSRIFLNHSTVPFYYLRIYVLLVMAGRAHAAYNS